MTPTVVCIWDPATCQWGTQTVYERDAWTALHTHLAKVHGHDAHAEKPRTGHEKEPQS